MPSYIWLLNRVTCLNLSFTHQISLSLHTLRGVQQSQLRMRQPSKSSSVFSEFSYASTKLKLRSSLFLRQGRRNAQRQNLLARHTQPLRSNFLHKGNLWQPTYLLRRGSFNLLGPALRRRHLNKVAPTLMPLAEVDRERTRRRLLLQRDIPSKFSKSSSAEARLRLFTQYLKLHNSTQVPLLGVKRRRRRLPKIPAYLFLGLRRPPLVVLRTPFTNLWKSFRKTTRRGRASIKALSAKKHITRPLSGLFRDFTSTPRWRRVLPPRPKARLKSASLRRWSKNLGRFRKKSLRSYFSKQYQRSKIRFLRSHEVLRISPLTSQEAELPFTNSTTSNSWLRRKPSSWTYLHIRKSFRDLHLSCRDRVLGSRLDSLSDHVLRETKLRNAFQSKRVLPNKRRNKLTWYLTQQSLKPTHSHVQGRSTYTPSSPLSRSRRKAIRGHRPFIKLFSHRLKSKRPRRIFRNRNPFRLKWTPVTRLVRRTYALSTGRLATSKLSTVRLPTPRHSHSNLHKVTSALPLRLNLGARLPSFNILSLTRNAKSHLSNQLTDTRTVLKVTPLYSATFVTSMFSFIGYSLTSPSRIADITRSVTDYSTDLKYLIFPDVNAAKAAVFRRLNKQRFLMRARTHLFNRIHFGNIDRNPRLELIHKPVQMPGAGLNESSLRGKAAMSVSRSWVLHNESRSICRSTYRTPRIGRIRFKPGYYRIWRLARSSAREILGFTSRYQYRLTPKLQRHYFQARSGSQDRLSLTVEFALLTSHLIPDHWSLKELLSSYSVYLNGTSCINPRLRLFCGDFLQLLINLKYYIALRWLDSWSVQKKTKVSKIFYRKLKPSPTNKAIKTVRKLPHWFFDLQYTHTDIPKYFEVDYFTLSIFLLHDYVNFERWLPSRARQLNPLAINMYNWKYIT